VKVTVVLEVLSYITTVAVEDKELVISPAASFLLCTTVKNLLQPGQSNVVIAPT
jgi:hypothetical protein